MLKAELLLVVPETFWQNRLGGQALDVLVLEVLGMRGRVVGVVTGDFDFPPQADAWAAVERLSQGESRTAHN